MRSLISLSVVTLITISVPHSSASFMGDPGDIGDKGLDLSGYEEGLAPLQHRAKRFISFPPSSTAKLSTKLTVPLFDEYSSYVSEYWQFI